MSESSPYVPTRDSCCAVNRKAVAGLRELLAEIVPTLRDIAAHGAADAKDVAVIKEWLRELDD